MAKCSEQGQYYDSVQRTEKPFRCNEDALESGHCMFHEEGYLNETTSVEIRQRFMEKIEESIELSQPFVCVGYILPEINLGNKIFDIPVYFNSTIFTNFTGFSKVQFNSDVVFEKVTFQNIVSFVGTEFCTFVKFSECIFERESHFLSGIYNKSIFEFNKFQDCLFSLSIFNKIDFIGNVFEGISEFPFCKFNGDAMFKKNSFYDVSNFSQSNYSKENNFVDNNFEKQVNFRDTYFQNTSNVFFDGNLSTISFYNTDISKIIFGTNVSWDIKYNPVTHFLDKIKISVRKFKNLNNKFKIQDEKILEHGLESNILLESVLDEYRKLRDRFDKQLRYDIAGEFFIREHEMKRKFKKNQIQKNKKNQPLKNQKNWIWRVLSIPAMYYFIGRYGESYRRPLEIVIPGLIFSTFYFWSSGFTNFDNILDNPAWIESIKSSILRSLSAFIPFLGFGTHYAISDLLLRLALLPISGTLFIALRRKLERKYS